MAVVCGFAVNRAEEVELFDDVGGFEAEDRFDGFFNFFLVDFVSAEGVDVDADRMRVADGVGELDFATVSKAGGDDIFRDIAAHVGSAAIDFRGIFAGEGPAAVAAHSTVGVDDDFAAGEPGVALRSTNDKAACGVDEELGRGVEEFLRNHFADDIVDDEAADFFVLHIVGVLGRDDDIGHADRLVVLIENRDLALRVGAEPFHFPGFADGGEFATEAVGEHDRGGHELGRFVASVAEHEALIAGALLGGGFAFGFAIIHTLRNVRALAGEKIGNENAVRVEDIVVVHIADSTDRRADDVADVENGIERRAFDFRDRDFAADNDGVAFNEGLARDAAGFVDGQAGIEDRIGDGVANLVWMAFANGFGGENKTTGHGGDVLG